MSHADTRGVADAGGVRIEQRIVHVRHDVLVIDELEELGVIRTGFVVHESVGIYRRRGRTPSYPACESCGSVRHVRVGFQRFVIILRIVIAVEKVQHDELAVESGVEFRLFGRKPLVAHIFIKERAGRQLGEHVGQHHVESHRDEGGEHDRRNDDGHGLHQYGALALLAERYAHHNDDEYQAQHAGKYHADEGPERIVRHKLVRLDAEYRGQYDYHRKAQDVEERFEDCEARYFAGKFLFVFSLCVFHFTAPPCRYFQKQAARCAPPEGHCRLPERLPRLRPPLPLPPQPLSLVFSVFSSFLPIPDR